MFWISTNDLKIPIRQHKTNKDVFIENTANNLSSYGKSVNQDINDKIEKGNCVIEYPKKIFCEYSDKNNKILVSNGSSLVIKTNTSYYLYPLDKTPLNFILDKNYLINKIYNLEERVMDGSFVNYKINESGNEITAKDYLENALS